MIFQHFHLVIECEGMVEYWRYIAGFLVAYHRLDQAGVLAHLAYTQPIFWSVQRRTTIFWPITVGEIFPSSCVFAFWKNVLYYLVELLETHDHVSFL